MKLVFNPSTQNSVVYNDEGQMVAPGEWAYLEESRTIQQFINDGALVELDVPDKMPDNVAPGAAQALREAIEDKQSSIPDVSEEPAESPSSTKVRNTGRSKRTTTQNKEA